jgi:DNA-directed RNA polymerase subunit RPC12/RpoP
MDRSPKCPKCKTPINVEVDSLPKGKWPMSEWPIYKCSNCNAYLEQSGNNFLFLLFGLVVIIAVAQLAGNIIGYILSGGNESIANICGWVASAFGMVWLALKPEKLVEREHGGKQQ